MNLDIQMTEGVCLIQLQESCEVMYGQQVKGSPHVRLPPVAFPADHLRAHPVRSARDGADACPRHTDCLQPFAGPKVPKLHIPSRVTENIGTWTETRNEDSCFHAIQLLDPQPRERYPTPNTRAHGMALSPLSLR